MLEQLRFVVAYVGSAAVVAFLAECAISPRVATYTCQATAPDAHEHCVLVATFSPKHGDAGRPNLDEQAPSARHGLDRD